VYAKLYVGLSVLILAFLPTACNGPEGPGDGTGTGVPSVTTKSVSDVSSTQATVQYSIDETNGSAVLESGTCYSSVYTNPTLGNSPYTSDGTGTGDMSSQLDGLYPRTSYSVRSYATNASGTGYGEALQLVTTNALFSGSYFKDGVTSGETTHEFAVLDDAITYTWASSDGAHADVSYSYVKRLASNPSNGFVVNGIWFCYQGTQNAYWAKYFVVHQLDSDTLTVRTSDDGYEDAYDYGSPATFAKD
jgi:hypothetical protein